MSNRREFLKGLIVAIGGWVTLRSFNAYAKKPAIPSDKLSDKVINTSIMLELNARFCSAEALVNGIPVARSTPDGVRQTQLPIHEFLMPEKNKILLVVEPGATPSQALKPRGLHTYEPTAWAHICIRQMLQGSFPEDPGVKQLLNIEFQPPPDNRVPMPKPFLKGAELSGFPWLKRWRWMDAAPITMSASITDQVIRFLQPIHDGLSKGDPETFIRAAQISFDETIMAYKPMLDNLRESFRNDLKEDFKEPGFKFEPIDPKKLDLRLCGNNNVIDCVDVNWQPVLRAVKRKDGSTPSRYPVKVAFIDDKLQIVR